MRTLKEYVDDAFLAITSLGTFYFYVIMLIFLLIIGKVALTTHLAIGLAVCYLFVFIIRFFYFKERPKNFHKSSKKHSISNI